MGGLQQAAVHGHRQPRGGPLIPPLRALRRVEQLRVLAGIIADIGAVLQDGPAGSCRRMLSRVPAGSGCGEESGVHAPGYLRLMRRHVPHGQAGHARLG